MVVTDTPDMTEVILRFSNHHEASNKEDPRMDPAERELFNEFQNRMLRSSLKLTVIGHEGHPVTPASGLMIAREGRLFVVSAGHALVLGRWSIETDVIFNRDGMCVHFTLTNPVSYCHSRLRSRNFVDFAWCELNREMLREQISRDEALGSRVAEELFGCYQGPFLDPVAEMHYGFVMHNATFYDKNRREQDRSAAGEMYMEFDGVDSRNGFHRFKLAREHQGEEYYGGCSGAPIAGFDGAVVSLVQGCAVP